MFMVLIQHAADTGRYHPAYYRLAPMPGGITSPARYKSGGHHTEGFETLEAAQANAAELAGKLPFPVRVPEDGFEVIDLPEAGPDIVLREGLAA